MNNTTTTQVQQQLADLGFDEDAITASIGSFINADDRDMDETGWTREDITVVREQLTSGPVTAQVTQLGTGNSDDMVEVRAEDGTVLAEVAVEPSEDPEPYDLAVRALGFTDVTWDESGL